MFEAVKRKQNIDRQPGKQAEGGAVNVQLRRMAGLPQKGCDSRDPVSHVQDVFFTGFATHGRAMAQLEGAPFMEAKQPEMEREEAQQSAEQRQAPPTGGMEERYQGSAFGYANEQFYHRFADTAFSKGDLAAGVLQGKGKMMLVSTMKQALGQSPPDNERERKLWANTSAHKKLPLGDARVVFNKGEVRSAVGLTVDSIASGRNALNDMREAALLCGRSKGGGETLLRLYPFLSVEEDRQSLENIRRQLREAKGGQNADKQRMLEYGERKMQAMIEKKEAMRIRFIQLIDELSANAQRAEEEFSEAGFSDQLFRELYAYAPEEYDSGEDMPPEDEEDDPEEGSSGAEDPGTSPDTD